MFNFNINWPKIIKENLPGLVHTPRRLQWIKALMAPFNKIYQELLVAFEIFVLKIRYTGQVIYLEKILNDKFSPVFGGIYIVNGNTVPKFFLYNKIELKPPRYLYSNWKAATNYTVGGFAVYQNKVWKALVNNSGSIPSITNANWSFYKDLDFLRIKSEFNIVFDFIVMVPISVTYNTLSMRGIVDYYRLAGKHYKIQTY